MVDPVTNMPIVILKDKDGDRVLPIWVGIFEANAIALQIENVATPRPMTHDLLGTSSRTWRASRKSRGGLRPQGQHLLRRHHLTVKGGAGRHRRAPERRHRPRPADAVRRSSSRRTSSTPRRRWTSTPRGPTATVSQKWLESLDPDEARQYKM
jgi:hypothetical protein